LNNTVEIKKDYCSFVIITGMKHGIPLIIEKGKFAKKMWKLPGGRPEAGEYPEVTAIREVSDEIGVIVKYPEKTILKKNKGGFNFIVFEAKYYSGEVKPNNEIERVRLFSFEEIEQAINRKHVLSDHAEALLTYIGEQKAFA